MNQMCTTPLSRCAQIRRKYGAGKGNRTPILSLEGSRQAPQTAEITEPCASILGMFTPNAFNGLHPHVHRFFDHFTLWAVLALFAVFGGMN